MQHFFKLFFGFTITINFLLILFFDYIKIRELHLLACSQVGAFRSGGVKDVRQGTEQH